MLTTSLLAALAITGVQPKPWSCDLAPSVGQGSSDQGSIDSITILNFGCRYQIASVMGVGISPQIGVDKQLWSVYQKNDLNKDISSYDTTGMSVGFRLDMEWMRGSKIFYGFAAGQGKGSLNLTQSTDQSSFNGTFSDVKNNTMLHTLGASYAVTENLSLSLAAQHQTSDQSWSNEKGELLLQNVDENNALTLTGGTLALTSSEKAARSSNHVSANLVQLGLSFQFGE